MRSIICPHCRTLIEDVPSRIAAPITCPACAEPIEPEAYVRQTPEWIEEQQRQGNVMTPMSLVGPRRSQQSSGDGIVSLNLRWKDNLIQAGVILGCTVVGVGIGVALGPRQHAVGALLGAFAGLVLGTIGSGIGLMIYRSRRR